MKLEEMRNASSRYLEVKTIRGQYCVFEARGVYDRERKRSIKLTRYLGRISTDGAFTEARHRNVKTEGVEIAKAERVLLEQLSIDCRMSMAGIGRRSGLGNGYVYRKIKGLETKLGIRYIAEIDVGKFGYSYYLAFVNTKGAMHSSVLKRTLEKEPVVQLAMTLNGRYNLLLCFLARDEGDANEFIMRLIKFSELQRFVAEWHVTYAFFDYNFIPLRDRFFDLLRERIWSRTKERPRKGSGDLLYREYAVLKELNSNGNIDFADIDRKHGFEKGAAQYTYYKLRRNGTIKSMSITMERLPMRYVGLLPLRIRHGGRFAVTEDKLDNEIKGYSELSTAKYAFVCSIGAPYGMLLALPVFGENDLRIAAERLVSKVKGIRLGHPMVVVGIPVGSLCYRAPLRNRPNALSTAQRLPLLV